MTLIQIRTCFLVTHASRPRHGTEPGSAPGHKEQGLKMEKIPKGRYYNQHAKPQNSQIGFGLHKAGALKHTTPRHGAFSPFACSPMQQQSHGFKSHFTEFPRPFVCRLSTVGPGKVLVKRTSWLDSQKAA